MRELEVRRHSKRVARPGQHLTQWGVDLARTVGAGLGRFDLVVTSPLARCVETAVAMGLAVNETDARLAGPDGAGERLPGVDFDGDAGRAGLARLIQAGGPVATFVREQSAVWREIALRVPDGGRALVVVHGGAFLDGVALALRPGDATLAVGALSSYCEGVRLRYDPDPVSVEWLAVDPG